MRIFERHYKYWKDTLLSGEKTMCRFKSSWINSLTRICKNTKGCCQVLHLRYILRAIFSNYIYEESCTLKNILITKNTIFVTWIHLFIKTKKWQMCMVCGMWYVYGRCVWELTGQDFFVAEKWKKIHFLSGNYQPFENIRAQELDVHCSKTVPKHLEFFGSLYLKYWKTKVCFTLYYISISHSIYYGITPPQMNT